MSDAEKLACKVCDRGELVRGSLFRMSRPVVLIGYILLVPSIAGMALSVGALLYVNWLSGRAAYEQVHIGTANEAQRQIAMAGAEMQGFGIPEEIVHAIVYPGSRGVPTPDDLPYLEADFPNLTSTQRDMIHYEAERVDKNNKLWADALANKPDDATAGIGILGFIGSGLAVAVGVASFVGGLLGWLLLMKKRVLQCSVCSAVINAS